MKKVIIVGGGFSGLIAANVFKNNNIDFLLLEKNDRVGKKILATGNGRCNFTNEVLNESYYHGANPQFCSYAIKKHDNEAIRGFFENLGVLSAVENGRIYPLSLNANSILDALRLNLTEKEVITNSNVTNISTDGRIFTVYTEREAFEAEKVILAFGGKAGGHFGTDGSSYALAARLGHKLTELKPSLVQMKCDLSAVKGLKGIKQKAEVSLYTGNRFVKKCRGDLLFTDKGVSGNAVFSLSSYLRGEKNAKLVVDFAPDVSLEELKSSLYKRIKAFPQITGDKLLSGAVASVLSAKIAAETGIRNVKTGDIKKELVAAAAEKLKNYAITDISAAGFGSAQVTSGGISTDGVDEITFESKIVKGLYIVGEALDIDGDCGGYNLQFAFSSSMCAAEAII